MTLLEELIGKAGTDDRIYKQKIEIEIRKYIPNIGGTKTDYKIMYPKNHHILILSNLKIPFKIRVDNLRQFDHVNIQWYLG